MKIVNYPLTKNDCYKVNQRMKIRGIMLHSVGCPQEDPKVFAKSWDRPGLQKCVHAFVGSSVVYHTLPYDVKSWHCGYGPKGSYNTGYISV